MGCLGQKDFKAAHVQALNQQMFKLHSFECNTQWFRNFPREMEGLQVALQFFGIYRPGMHRILPYFIHPPYFLPPIYGILQAIPPFMCLSQKAACAASGLATAKEFIVK